MVFHLVKTVKLLPLARCQSSSSVTVSAPLVRGVWAVVTPGPACQVATCRVTA